MHIPTSEHTEMVMYVKRLFETLTEPYLVYHNIQHTQQVVQRAREMATHYTLSETENFILMAAAWFHDTGQLLGEITDHEQISVDLMKIYFTNRPIGLEIQNDIAQCIMATKYPVHPVTLLEKIICDADTYHLGTPDFLYLDNLVWQELELRTHSPIDNKINRSLYFLQTHQFYTDYCQRLLTAGKEQNIAFLMKKMPES
jgi:predicted metal-dependent HD superfamily phosphohydrolase